MNSKDLKEQPQQVMFKFIRDVLFIRKKKDRGQADRSEKASPLEVAEEEKVPREPEIVEEVKEPIVESKM